MTEMPSQRLPTSRLPLSLAQMLLLVQLLCANGLPMPTTVALSQETEQSTKQPLSSTLNDGSQPEPAMPIEKNEEAENIEPGIDPTSHLNSRKSPQEDFIHASDNSQIIGQFRLPLLRPRDLLPLPPLKKNKSEITAPPTDVTNPFSIESHENEKYHSKGEIMFPLAGSTPNTEKVGGTMSRSGDLQMGDKRSKSPGIPTEVSSSVTTTQAFSQPLPLGQKAVTHSETRDDALTTTDGERHSGKNDDAIADDGTAFNAKSYESSSGNFRPTLSTPVVDISDIQPEYISSNTSSDSANREERLPDGSLASDEPIDDEQTFKQFPQAGADASEGTIASAKMDNASMMQVPTPVDGEYLEREYSEKIFRHNSTVDNLALDPGDTHFEHLISTESETNPEHATPHNTSSVGTQNVDIYKEENGGKLPHEMIDKSIVGTPNNDHSSKSENSTVEDEEKRTLTTFEEESMEQSTVSNTTIHPSDNEVFLESKQSGEFATINGTYEYSSVGIMNGRQYEVNGDTWLSDNRSMDDAVSGSTRLAPGDNGSIKVADNVNDTQSQPTTTTNHTSITDNSNNAYNNNHTGALLPPHPATVNHQNTTLSLINSTNSSEQHHLVGFLNADNTAVNMTIDSSVAGTENVAPVSSNLHISNYSANGMVSNADMSLNLDDGGRMEVESGLESTSNSNCSWMIESDEGEGMGLVLRGCVLESGVFTEVTGACTLTMGKPTDLVIEGGSVNNDSSSDEHYQITGQSNASNIDTVSTNNSQQSPPASANKPPSKGGQVVFVWQVIIQSHVYLVVSNDSTPGQPKTCNISDYIDSYSVPGPGSCYDVSENVTCVNGSLNVHSDVISFVLSKMNLTTPFENKDLAYDIPLDEVVPYYRSDYDDEYYNGYDVSKFNMDYDNYIDEYSDYSPVSYDGFDEEMNDTNDEEEPEDMMDNRIPTFSDDHPIPHHPMPPHHSDNPILKPPTVIMKDTAQMNSPDTDYEIHIDDGTIVQGRPLHPPDTDGSGIWQKPAVKFHRTHHNLMRRKGYQPPSIHGLVWEDREYLLSVLIPVILGILGALLIVCMAYSVRSCSCSSPPEKVRPQQSWPSLPYFDEVKLLAEHSEEEV